MRRPPITWSEFQQVAAAPLRHTAQVSAQASAEMAVNLGANRLPGIAVNGVTPNYAPMFNLEFESGRFFSEEENRSAANVAVIGNSTREGLFPGVDPLGRTFLLRGLPFQVVGVMPKHGSGFGTDEDTRIYVPIQVYRKNFMPTDGTIELMVKAAGGVAGVEASQDELRAFFRAMRHTPFAAADPFGMLTQETLQQLWRQISGAAFLLMLLVSSVSLGVGGIVIMNIMLVSVVERTREIGIRLAIGARKQDIRRQFLMEASTLSLLGGAVGALLGSGFALALRGLTGFPAEVTPAILGTGVALAALVGLGAGFLPARRASNLPVIDAIRAE
jgi:putative ABC transport system permease protein